MELTEQQLKVAVKKYFNAVKNVYNAGNIESTYNKLVIDLIESFGCKAMDFSGGRSGSTGENIDIKLWHKDEDIHTTEPFGAIEVKKIGGKDKRAKEQIIIEANRYGNVILTDNTTWEFYHADDNKMYNGFELIKKNNKNELELNETKIELFITSIKDFILTKPVNIKSSNKLAYYMAEYAKTIRATVFNILQANNSKPMYNELFALYSKLKNELLPELTISDFADMYAQTIVYGLFIARYNDKSLSSFSRGEAIENLSKESHLLKQFFQHIATSGNLHPTLNDTIDKLCNLFTITDLPQLLNEYEKKDTIVHFYEDFLSCYDAAQRKNFGAYYTPVQVVRYMVDMVDNILVNDFKINGGLSNNDTVNIKVKCDEYFTKKERKTEKEISVPNVAILDPACGTGTFGAEIIKFIKEKYFSGSNEVFYKDWIQQKDGLLSRLICFEIMMTSYVVTHLKIRRVITETLGKLPDENLPTNIFLTNTLAEPKSIVEKNSQIGLFDFSGAITDEAENADKWKTRRPIKVIIGNPPYLASSTNPYDIAAYKFETDGKTKLNEKNPKWLNDDYVKFIRFAEQHIDNDGKGILAFISNNGYLDNPTFRGMRASLLRSFDRIYILNLHGNSIKQETAPDGSKDENVFDIRIGVAIIIAIKTTQSTEWAKVNYGELYGLREDKFNTLEDKDVQFTEIKPDKKTAIFVPQNNVEKEEYDNGISLVDLFNTYSAGMVLGRDSLCVQNTKQEIQNIIKDFQTIPSEDLRTKYSLGKDTDWTVDGAIKDIEDRNGKITQIAYRVFDNRWTYYTGKQNGFHCRPRGDVMRNFVDTKENVGLCFTRTDKSQRKYSMVFLTDKITESCILTSQTAGIATVVPLYVKTDDMLGDYVPNFNKEELDKLTQNLKDKPQPQEIFDYCYGILYDPNYREKYNEFLKRDYPKVAVIENEKVFSDYSKFGKQLKELHLIKTDAKLDLQIEPNDAKNLQIEFVKYLDEKLFINKQTSINGIPQNVWEYMIGGYQVLDKWFKSHKGELFDFEKFNHIQKVAGILAETIKIQEQLKHLQNF
jgi:predicted helicase